MSHYSIFPIGNQAVTISLGEVISLQSHHKIIHLARWVQENAFPGLLDVVVAYSSLTVVYDLYTLRNAVSSDTVFDFIKQYLTKAYTVSDVAVQKQPNLKRVPVCYERPFSPDMDLVCKLKNLTPGGVIELHTSTTYHVYMIGFLPGFPYMAHVHERLVVPRKETPRMKVDAGSVGLAGEQTGIYPMASPGGWQIIGRTPLRIFNKDNDPPVFLEPGDEVQFYAITKAEWTQFNQ